MNLWTANIEHGLARYSVDGVECGVISRVCYGRWFWRFFANSVQEQRDGYVSSGDKARRIVERLAAEQIAEQEKQAAIDAMLPTQEELVGLITEQPFKALALLTTITLIGLAFAFALLKVGLDVPVPFVPYAILFLTFIATLEAKGRLI